MLVCNHLVTPIHLSSWTYNLYITGVALVPTYSKSTKNLKVSCRTDSHSESRRPRPQITAAWILLATHLRKPWIHLAILRIKQCMPLAMLQSIKMPTKVMPILARMQASYLNLGLAILQVACLNNNQHSTKEGSEASTLAITPSRVQVPVRVEALTILVTTQGSTTLASAMLVSNSLPHFNLPIQGWMTQSWCRSNRRRLRTLRNWTRVHESII